GFNSYLPRLAAFTISGACASLAGVLFALKAACVSPDVLRFVVAGAALIAALVGGVTPLIGPVVGGVLFIYAQSEFSESGNLQLYTGLALIIAVAFLRGGVTGTIARGFERLRSTITQKRGAR